MNEEYAVRLHIERVENGQFLATSEDIPGLVAQGRTVAETIEIAQAVARKLVESYRDHGDELPKDLRRIHDSVDIDVAVTAADSYDLDRFVDAQDRVADAVTAELEAGGKRSHWMWFVFPQVQGLGSSSTARPDIARYAPYASSRCRVV